MSQQKIPWTRVIAEGVVILASVLAALALDAWWDGRQLGSDREAFLAALSVELEETRGLLEATIPIQSDADRRVHALLLAADTLDRLSVDSLRALAYPAFQPVFFVPPLREYQETSRSMDRLGLKETELMNSLAVVERFLLGHRRLTDSFSDMNFLGPVYDLRLSLGSLYALTGPSEISGATPERFSLSDAEFRAFLERPDVYAALETLRVLQSAKLRQLQGMDDAAAEALGLLRSTSKPAR